MLFGVGGGVEAWGRLNDECVCVCLCLCVSVSVCIVEGGRG